MSLPLWMDRDLAGPQVGEPDLVEKEPKHFLFKTLASSMLVVGNALRSCFTWDSDRVPPFTLLHHNRRSLRDLHEFKRNVYELRI